MNTGIRALSSASVLCMKGLFKMAISRCIYLTSANRVSKFYVVRSDGCCAPWMSNGVPMWVNLAVFLRLSNFVTMNEMQMSGIKASDIAVRGELNPTPPLQREEPQPPMITPQPHTLFLVSYCWCRILKQSTSGTLFNRWTKKKTLGSALSDFYGNSPVFCVKLTLARVSPSEDRYSNDTIALESACCQLNHFPFSALFISLSQFLLIHVFGEWRWLHMRWKQQPHYFRQERCFVLGKVSMLASLLTLFTSILLCVGRYSQNIHMMNQDNEMTLPPHQLWKFCYGSRLWRCLVGKYDPQLMWIRSAEAQIRILIHFAPEPKTPHTFRSSLTCGLE